MKGFLLTTALLFTIGSSALAQVNIWQNYGVDRRWDIGFNYGASTITRPLGPEKFYQGSRTKVTPEYSFTLQYVIDPHWHINFNVGWRKWESYGTWSLPYSNGTQLKPTEVKFQLGKPVLSEVVQLNYVIPFYTKYDVMNKANLYFGVTAGMVNTVSDGSVSYSKYNNEPDSSFRYVSGYNYASGIGYMVGIQAGYTYYFLRRWGVNVELGARYANVTTHSTNGVSDPHATTSYNVMFFPGTLGLRYRFR